LSAGGDPRATQVSVPDEDVALASRHRTTRGRHLDRHVALVGFMGAGKSTIGRALAERLDRPFLDSDEAVQARTGRTVQELFAAGCETEFRRLEEDAVADLLAGPPAVIALGGGALVSERTRAALVEASFVIHLYLSWAEVKASLARLSGDRPLLQRPLAEIHQLFLERQRSYADAHVRIHVPRDDPTSAIQHVLYALRRGI
jgi:shikimate kinase